MPKPASDLERYLAGDFPDAQEALPVAIVLAAALVLLVALLY